MQQGFDRADPHAAALIESLRAFGYSPQAAVADLLDNSISAGARNIRMNFHWAGANSTVTFLDDGQGMTLQQLVEAMRPGGKGPLEERGTADLGRFGLGLKTASFSQCRRLTVATRTRGETIHIRRWDLDYVAETGEWRLLHGFHPGSEQHLSPLEDLQQGTLVLWENMDRLTGGTTVADQQAHKRFLNTMDSIEAHLSMVFHRFLEKKSGLRIHLNDEPVVPWDPFLSWHETTQQLPVTQLTHQGIRIEVTPYVLPHRTRLNDEQFKKAAGPRGWNEQQGFYVYRNNRILVAGGWLGLGFQREKHHSLSRIRIDLPSSLDLEWDIDVRKSRAYPPGPLKEPLHQIAELTRARAVEVYRKRTQIKLKTTGPQETHPTWETFVTNRGNEYRISREHPVVQALNQKLGAERGLLGALLRLLETSVPVERIWLDVSEHPDRPSPSLEDSDPAEIRQLALEVYRGLRSSGLDSTASALRMQGMAFGSIPGLIETILQEEK